MVDLGIADLDVEADFPVAVLRLGFDALEEGFADERDDAAVGAVSHHRVGFACAGMSSQISEVESGMEKRRTGSCLAV